MWAANLPWPTISYVVGIFVAILGLGISYYFQYRKDKREAEALRLQNERDAAESEAIIAAYKKGVGFGKQHSAEQSLD